MPTDQITIRGAREHNLKNVTLSIPRDKLVVFTGLSGSGKSSLAFDTIYAEGQRRYVESLSAYARQFLGQVVKGRKGEYRSLIEDVRKSGFVRVRVDGSLYEIGEKIPMDKNKKHDVQVVVDRIAIGPEQRTRLVDSIETAAKMGGGSVIIAPERQGGAAVGGLRPPAAKGGVPPQFDGVQVSQDYA